jgi:integrase/recombinase XerD
MSAWSEELDRYLTVRRSLGYDLRTAERILRRFIAFAERESALNLSTDLVLRWQASAPPVRQQTSAARLRTVRIFAQWLHGLDPKHDVPLKDLVPRRRDRRRPQPYIYSEDEIRRIIAAAAELPSINGLRAPTCSTLFGLIAVTGLRVSEAVALDRDDVDLEAGVLTIRRGKLGKARLLPLVASTIASLAAYARERDRLLGGPPPWFFVSDRGKRLSDCGARYNFAAVCQHIGLRPAEKYHRHGHGPRIHDLRHSFAVRTLIDCYRDGGDVGQTMLKLATYLGHAVPAHTYWYIEAVPELLEMASRRASAVLAEEVPA